MPKAKPNRGLPPEFVHELQTGFLAPLLAAAKRHGLDVQLRNRYLELYHDGASVLQLSYQPRAKRYDARIHAKFVVGAKLPPARSEGLGYVHYDVAAPFVGAYLRALPELLANAAPHCGPERAAQQRLIATSMAPDSPIVFFDRQVRAEGDDRSEVDALGLTRDTTPRLVIGKVKWQAANDIQRVRERLTRYQSLVTGPDGRLEHGLVVSYRAVIKQKQRLGLLPLDLRLPDEAPEVIGLVLLCDYPDHAALPDRGGAPASPRPLELWLVRLAGPDYRVPPLADWQRL